MLGTSDYGACQESDENDAKVFEVKPVARGEGCPARVGDAGDLNVTDFNRSADYPLPSGYCGRAFCRGSNGSTRPPRISSVARLKAL
jgi:hypothetical protein